MIIIADGGQEGAFVSRGAYYRGKSIVTKSVMALTKRLRAAHASRYLGRHQRHLDIGCGDGYLMKRSPCSRVYGIDPLYGDIFNGRMEFPDGYFDYVTMLAVIEHLDIGPELIFSEVHRVLKSGGPFHHYDAEVDRRGIDQIIRTPCPRRPSSLLFIRNSAVV